LTFFPAHTPTVLVPGLLLGLAACAAPPVAEGPREEAYTCGSAPSFGYEAYPTDAIDYVDVFLYTRGYLWMSVDEACVLDVWQGTGRSAEVSRPLAERRLTAAEYGALREEMGVDAWDAHADAEFETEDDGAFLGTWFTFLSGDRVMECAYCAPWIRETVFDLNSLVEELYVGAEPVADGRPLYAATSDASWLDDPASYWSTPWTLDVAPAVFALSEARTTGALATEEQAVWLRSVRDTFLARSGGVADQHAPLVVYDGAYYELYLREW
jgi:hypothetical protein